MTSRPPRRNDNRPKGPRRDGDGPRNRKPHGDKGPRKSGGKPFDSNGKKPYGKRADGGDNPWERSFGKPGDKQSDRPRGKPFGKPGEKPRGKPFGKPGGGKRFDRTRDDRPQGDRPPGSRVAKVIARSGLCSRRDAEGLIALGRVAVNGKEIDTPALNITRDDTVIVDGKRLAEAAPARVWLYHKPTGLVTTTRDEKGRETIYDRFPRDLPRVMTVGRLDLTSEGLLLLTNDGELKRRLELPDTGWLRRYRVRVNGTPNDAQLAPLREGIEMDGEHFAPMIVELDRQQGANAWLTVGLREGKNREIRRAMESIGLQVNRLIRVSYGPFQLGDLKSEAVEEIKPRILADQLGSSLADGITLADAALPREDTRPRGPKKDFGDRPRRDNERGPRKFGDKDRGTRKDFGDKPYKSKRFDDAPRETAEERKARKLSEKKDLMANPSRSLRKGGKSGVGFKKRPKKKD